MNLDYEELIKILYNTDTPGAYSKSDKSYLLNKLYRYLDLWFTEMRVDYISFKLNIISSK